MMQEGIEERMNRRAHVSEVLTTGETPHNGSNFSSSAHVNFAHENTRRFHENTRRFHYPATPGNRPTIRKWHWPETKRCTSPQEERYSVRLCERIQPEHRLERHQRETSKRCDGEPGARGPLPGHCGSEDSEEEQGEGLREGVVTRLGTRRGRVRAVGARLAKTAVTVGTHTRRRTGSTPIRETQDERILRDMRAF